MPVSLQRVFSLALSALLVLGVMVALAAPSPARAAQYAPDGQTQHEEFNILVFSKTAGYRHQSIPDGIAAIKQLGQENHFGVTATEDAGAFTYDNLSQYEAVVWLSTTGDVLNDSQQAAFEKYIKDGGGYAGIHAAADTEYDWPFYGKLVGAYFDSHPSIQEATVHVTDRVHPSTEALPRTWTRTDEWYNYASNPRGDVHVLATLDESTYDAGNGGMGHDHPISWCQGDIGRSWYTGMGHTAASYSDQMFLDHILGGIRTAAGAANADCGATNWSNFDQVTLAQGPEEVGEPMGMAVLPDGGVLHSERQGTLYHTTPDGETSVAADIPIYSHDEEGLQSIAIDSNFEQNRWVYVYYAPPLDTPSGDAPETAEDPSVFEDWQGYTQLSRFKFQGGKLDLSTEQEILRVDADRGICCHVGGDITFGPDGDLYLSTGDDTNPFQSSGYTPIDERETRNPAFDAQRSSANTNDLRGKVLRIDVQADGSYTIPDGNMFAGDSSDKTRSEIYAMGFRNPYRISVDQQTGVLYVGDYGPDAGSADPDRGPGGQVEFNRITEPGFYGWPYCTGKNDAYHDYDFATSQSGPEFDCAGGPVNDSPNNDGLNQLPAAKQAWLPYDGDSVPQFGDGSESPMGGPVYRYDADSTSKTKFPAYFGGKFFAYEWGRGWIKTISMTQNGQPAEIDPFFPTMTLTRPMDVEFGPQGSLYVLDYGSGFFGGAEDSALYRIDYVKGDRAPKAVISAEPTSGRAPLEVQFSSQGSSDPDPGSSISYAWDFDGDGQTDSTAANPTHTYTAVGEYSATLIVTDKTGKSGTASEQIVVGNTEPDVTIQKPKNGQVFGFGDSIDYTVTVKDPDGTQTDCSKVKVEYVLGHSTGDDSHGHPLSQSSGCQGTIDTANTDGHQGADIYGVLHASYTDNSPNEQAPALTGEDETILQPRNKQAEFFSGSQGIQVVQNGGAQAGARVGYIEPGDWISFQPYNLAGVNSMSLRVSSGGAGGTIEVHSGSPGGPLVATAEVPNTGGYSNYETVGPVTVTDPGGTGKLFLIFQGSGSGGLFDVDSFTFHGKGAASNRPPAVSVQANPVEGGAPLAVDFTATATDPDGQSVSHAWDFTSDGTTDSTKLSPSFTYEKDGEYTATFTATDAQGLSTSTSVGITAFPTLPACEKPNPNPKPGDDFEGDQLDTCRWTDIVRQNADHFGVKDGALRIDALPGDMYGGTTNARNLVLQEAPKGHGWTAVTKVNLDSSDDYAQAGLMVYGSDTDFAKAVLINVPGQGWRVEFTQQVDGQPAFTTWSDVLPGDWPEGSYLKVAYDGKALTASYSADGQDWTKLGRAGSLRAIPNPKVGLASYNGTGESASFESFRLDTQTAKPCTPSPDPGEGYQPLFNGTEPSLDKWRQAGPGGFLYADCELVSYGGMGLYWYSGKQFDAPYSLKLDWKKPGDDNSGVFVGFPDVGDDPWVAVNKGEEIQIDPTDDPANRTGAVYDEQAPDLDKVQQALKPDGEWNTYNIVVKKNSITVYLNGVKVNHWVDDDPDVDLSQGHVGIQNHGGSDENHFRNIRVKQLPE